MAGLIIMRAQFDCICFQTGEPIHKGQLMAWDKERSLVYAKGTTTYLKQHLLDNGVSRNTQKIRR